jgi:hypothetical protein
VSFIAVTAAALSAFIGVVLLVAAFADDPDTAPGVLVGAGAFFFVIALALAWGASAVWQAGTRAQLLLLTAVGALFALLPIHSLIGWVGYALNVLCATVAVAALIALLFGRRRERPKTSV